MMLWGPPGTGKTTLAATAPGRKLWLNFDPRGTTSLIGRDDVLVVDMAEERPNVVEKFKSEDPLQLTKFIEDNDISTIVFDSTTNFADLATRYAVANVNHATMEKPSIEAYGFRNAYVLQAVKNLLRLTGRLNKHMIFIGHEDTPTKAKDGTVLFISIMLGGKLSEQVPLDLSEVWGMRDEGGKREIAIRPAWLRKPMKTRMFKTDGERSFPWKYNPNMPVGKQGEGIADWYNKYIETGAKIALPK